MKKPVHYPTYVHRIKGKGWGAFCSKRIPKGKIFNVTTLLVLTVREAKLMSGSSLEPYWYQFGTKGRAIALGLGSILNHSDKPNCSYHFSEKKRTLSFYALKDIPPHEELTHDYGWTSVAYKNFGVQRDLPSKNKNE
ncbi:MAG: SET domain-containing protein-lysine N-methyltransferase [Bdellovibrionota bacterium]